MRTDKKGHVCPIVFAQKLYMNEMSFLNNPANARVRESAQKLARNVCALSFLLGAVLSEVLAEKAQSGLVPTASADVASVSEKLKELSKKVEKRTLSNGLTVLFYQRGVAPVFSGVVAVRVGGVDEVPGETGISHMFEHMAFKGTDSLGSKDFPRERELLAKLEELSSQTAALNSFTDDQKKQYKTITKELQKLSSPKDLIEAYQRRGSSGMNATTGKDLTNYFVSMPRPALEFWLSIESERLLKTVMRQFYKERDVVMEERRMRSEDDPGGKLYELLLGAAYQKHPYRQPVVGYAEDIQHLTASGLEDFAKRFYVAPNMVVALVGDISAERDLDLVEKYFGRIPNGEIPKRTELVEPAQDGERRFTVQLPTSPQCYVAYRKPNFPHKDDAKISLMSEVLAGSVLSPLYKELVEHRRIATEVSHFEAPGNAYPNLLMFQLVPRAPHTNSEILSRFDQLVKEFIARTPLDQELAQAKRRIAVTYLEGFDSSSRIAQDLSYAQLIYGDWKMSLDWLDQVMAVTSEDVRLAAEQYLVTDQRTVGCIETKAR
jgi:predicted Zn-dependent peptidase